MGEKTLLVVKVLLPFKIETSGGTSETEEEDFAFVQYMGMC